MNHSLSRNDYLILFGLLLLSFFVYALGINEITGLTTKDEYYLTLRTPMCIIENNEWLVPCLDGHPRLKKPPMLYWIIASAYQLFGVSHTVARGVGVMFGLVLIVATVLITWELIKDRFITFFSALVLLSLGSLAIGNRMILLDIPTASVATLSFYFLLRWFNSSKDVFLTFAAITLACAFLIKGPVALLMPGTGLVAWLLVSQDAQRRLMKRWPTFLLAIIGFFALALSWFGYVHLYLPEILEHTFREEMQARNFFSFSLTPVGAILILGLPWSFFLIQPIVQKAWTKSPSLKFLMIWLALSILPFFFIKTFERYLYGSLVPFAIIIAYLVVQAKPPYGRLAARLGMFLSLIVSGVIMVAVWWFFGMDLTVGLGVIGWFVFLFFWWQAKHFLGMAASSITLWVFTFGAIYPKLTVNAIPPHIIELGHKEHVVMYEGPQPAMLPAALGRMLWHTNSKWHVPEKIRGGESFLVFVEEGSVAPLRKSAQLHHVNLKHLFGYSALNSRVSWINMWRKGLSREEVLRAIKERDIEALAPRIEIFRASMDAQR